MVSFAAVTHAQTMLRAISQIIVVSVDNLQVAGQIGQTSLALSFHWLMLPNMSMVVI